MKFSCCIEMLFTEYEFIERIYKARETGFEYFEFWNWQNKDIAAIKKAISETGIKLATFQGSLNGVMVDKNDFSLYISDVKKSITVAKELNAENIFCMSDIMQADRSVKPHKYSISNEEGTESSITLLKALVPFVEEAGITILIEPLNTIVDHSGYSLSHSASGVEIVKAVDSPHVRLLYDAYHMQIMEGNIIDTITNNSQYFGHFHIADVPGRHQPGTGELNYFNILKALKKSGYTGTVGFEFSPSGASSEKVADDILAMFKSI